jgi:hypothetical protein
MARWSLVTEDRVPNNDSERAMQTGAKFATSRTFRAGFVTGILFLAGSWHATAQTGPPVVPTPPSSASIPAPSVVEPADRLLKQMGAYVGSAEQFTFHADITFDHVLPSGQKLQFAAVEDVALQRPSGLYIEWSGDLGDRKFWYDGKTATIYDPATIFYGADAAPPALDDMLEKLIKQLNFTPPLVDFLYSDPYKSVRGAIQYGFTTGDTQINGRSCRGLAFVEKNIDWQIWIDSGPQPVPCKLLITYKNNSSLPQFSAIFSDWDFSPRIAVSTFTPELPPGTQKISFATVTASAGTNTGANSGNKSGSK